MSEIAVLRLMKSMPFSQGSCCCGSLALPRGLLHYHAANLAVRPASFFVAYLESAIVLSIQPCFGSPAGSTRHKAGTLIIVKATVDDDEIHVFEAFF
ncbi:hypothetical protein [Thauera sp. Sel9]|uniref:hypothetical protein n=1 Tax=Thauera sp. Sel9 TaxID=2974299 RepID=UPI0021E15E5C|nr:hypothetical protein [Thauera sp. Sel9]